MPVYLAGPNNTTAAMMYNEEGRLAKAAHMESLSGSSYTAYVLYRTYDSLGRTVRLRSEDSSGGALLDFSYEYDAEDPNNIRTGDGQLLREVNPFRYSGYQYDQETGLYYLNSRYYSPTLGRFLTRDVIPHKNLYMYGENNPVVFVDPSGLVSEMDEDGNGVGGSGSGGGAPILLYLAKYGIKGYYALKYTLKKGTSISGKGRSASSH